MIGPLGTNLNALILDYVARQKIQGQHLKLFIAEQLPGPPPVADERRIGCRAAAVIVRNADGNEPHHANLAVLARDWAMLVPTGRCCRRS